MNWTFILTLAFFFAANGVTLAHPNHDCHRHADGFVHCK